MNVNFDVYPNMDMNDNIVGAFFALLRAGLWEGTDVNLNDNVNWDEVYKLVCEQSVIGVVLAGIEYSNVKPPQELLLQWIGQVQLIEQQNKVMNQFVADLIEKLRTEDIHALLVKGQGIAQCYERPFWRTFGDVDLLLCEENYDKAKAYLTPLSSSVEVEGVAKKHLGVTINDFVVELHGTLHCGLSSRIDKQLDEIKKEVFFDGKVRSWLNGKTQVLLPAADEDVVYVFTHILQHFYKGGVGLRQICDWCRLLWTYRESLNRGLLESRIRKMGLISEWKAFGAFAIDYLGMPSEAMPLFNENDNQNHNLHRKAELIMDYVLEVGNFGHNRDMRYYATKPYLIRKTISLGRRCGDLLHHTTIFPGDSLKFFPRIMINGLRSVLRGE